ncbi:hypothetical protein Psi02_46600 [Planotetraspora silvatica]|uniref:Uncharacterized protein n=1 Tax=Planotetraspora silvatica TaxID=234614 RepID=A0A8J3UPL6_9ACTN|nr:hypothetical protein [Planotetraspora silvatica]GII48236.1 hypothetical protein Psi02_46600 [Planotetraspora silvatica]
MALHKAGTAFLRRTAASSGKPPHETTSGRAHGPAATHENLGAFRHDMPRAAVGAHAPRLGEAAVPL